MLKPQIHYAYMYALIKHVTLYSVFSFIETYFDFECT